MGQTDAPGSDSDSSSRTDSGGVWDRTEGNDVILSCCDRDCVTLWNFSSVWRNISSNKKNRQTGPRLGKISLSLPILCIHNAHCSHQVDPKGIQLNAGTDPWMGIKGLSFLCQSICSEVMKQGPLCMYCTCVCTCLLGIIVYVLYLLAGSVSCTWMAILHFSLICTFIIQHKLPSGRMK